MVGSGTSGLTVASDLIQKGHSVTVFEAFHKARGSGMQNPLEEIVIGRRGRVIEKRTVGA